MTAGAISRELWCTNYEFFSVDNIPPWFSISIYHLGMNNRPVGGHSSQTLSHPIDVIDKSVNSDAVQGNNRCLH
jgi:hypothetical protein